MNNQIKTCQLDNIKNDLDAVYSKYKFLCTLENDIWKFANDDFEAFAINLLFFLNTLDNEFLSLYDELNRLLGEDKK